MPVYIAWDTFQTASKCQGDASLLTSRLHLPTPLPSAQVCSPCFSAVVLTFFRNLFVFSVYRLVSRRCHTIDSIARAAIDVRYYEGSDS